MVMYVYSQSVVAATMFIHSSLFSCISLLICVTSFPVIKKNVIPTSEQIDFMQRYGYIENDYPGYQAGYSQEAIIEAIKHMQRFGGIFESGFFDNDTIKLMKRRKCSVKDVVRNHRSKRYTIVGKGWQRTNITYNIENWTPTLGEKKVKSEIKRALDIWSQNGSLIFIPIDDPKADIKISFQTQDHGDAYPFDGPGGVLGHAFYPYLRSGGSVHFDDEENWGMETDESGETTGFFMAALHELGHTLGIGHSDDPTAIMFPYYSETNPEGLHSDDILALSKLYKLNLTVKSEQMSTNAPLYSLFEDAESTTESINFEEQIDVNASLAICENFDTIAVLRKELFVFKGENVWRFKKRNQLEEGYPMSIKTIFPKLPENLKKIDAVYERNDGTLVFFSGPNHWIYTNENIQGPYQMDYYRLSNNLSVDAILLWPVNKKTYIFRGDHFWRYDHHTQLIDDGYPMNMKRWKGIPENITAAINWEGSTYFFKDLLCWKFNNVLIRADRRYPLPAPQIWFGCPESQELLKKLPEEILARGYI